MSVCTARPNWRRAPVGQGGGHLFRPIGKYDFGQQPGEKAADLPQGLLRDVGEQEGLVLHLVRALLFDDRQNGRRRVGSLVLLHQLRVNRPQGRVLIHHQVLAARAISVPPDMA